MIEELMDYVLSLRGKTFITKTIYNSWSPPITVISAGKKRVHIEVHGVGTFYKTTKSFLWMIMDDVQIFDGEPGLAKYYLNHEEERLLDI